jgi:hypothetical protein
VDIADRDAHRLLAYIAAVNDQGASLPGNLAEEYGRQAEREIIRVRDSFALKDMRQALATFQLAFAGSTEPEGWIRYLQRLGWARIEAHDGSHCVALTQLGRAVLRHLEQRQVPTDEAVAITVMADDPLSYAQMMGRVAGHQDAMLVDAYLTADALFPLLARTRVTRFLTSRKGRDQNQRIVEMMSLLERFNIGRTVQLRASNDFHDRYIIPRSGPVETLGTSMGSIGKYISTYTPLGEPVASVIREAHEAMWIEAEVLYPNPMAADNREPAADSAPIRPRG